METINNKSNIHSQKAMILTHLISGLEELIVELEKSQDSKDYNKFNSIKQNILKLNEEISKTVSELKD